MQTIYKYPLKITDEQILILPKGYEVLSVINQDDIPMLYAKVDSEEQKTAELFVNIFGTGNPIDDEDGIYKFLGTVSTNNGNLIWHIYTW